LIVKKSRHRFIVRSSTIARAGRGVFAGVPMGKGERLRVTGFLVRRGSLADRCAHYADPYKFRVGRDLLIPTGYGGLVNHSLRPNLVKIRAGKKIYLEARRAIATGEELFLKYGGDAVKRFRRTAMPDTNV
jgi:hypothetical protein